MFFSVCDEVARRAILAIFAVVLMGCSDDESPAPSGSICDDFATAYEEYVAGLTKPGQQGTIQVEWVSASPAPPAKGDNTWRLRVRDPGGTPLSDAEIVEVRPFMPDHGHGTTVVPVIGATASDGTVEVEHIDFRMAGVWTVTVVAATAAGDTDRAVFGLCIDG